MVILKFLIATWYIQLYTPIYGFWAVHGVDSLHVWVCGDSGIVVQTEDGGNTWAWHYIGKSVTLEDVWFVTDKIGWVVGDSNIVAKTVDGGNTWTVQVVGDSGYERFIRVQFIDSLIGWIGGKYLYKTEDGGLTWHKLPGGSGKFHFIDRNRGFCIYGWYYWGHYLRYTADGGNTWIEYPNLIWTGDTILLSNIFFVDEKWGCGATWWDTYLTTTSGSLWVLQPAHAAGKGLWFLNRHRGWSVGGFGSNFISEWRNGYWYEDEAPGIIYLNDVWFADTLHGWAVGWYPWFPANEGWIIKYHYSSEVEESHKPTYLELIYRQEGILLKLDDYHTYNVAIFDITGRLIESFKPTSSTFLWKPKNSAIYFVTVKENDKVLFLKKILWIK